MPHADFLHCKLCWIKEGRLTSLLGKSCINDPSYAPSLPSSGRLPTCVKSRGPGFEPCQCGDAHDLLLYPTSEPSHLQSFYQVGDAYNKRRKCMHPYLHTVSLSRHEASSSRSTLSSQWSPFRANMLWDSTILRSVQHPSGCSKALHCRPAQDNDNLDLPLEPSSLNPISSLYVYLSRRTMTWSTWRRRM